uniref:Uncharacterized protein n=1 Tax=Molossus molossus TaxID=27622 RepID=A0A7J8JWN2_MOLMO|nr:hypothetical protein HJG59_007825 [Molossus molossus]
MFCFFADTPASAATCTSLRQEGCCLLWVLRRPVCSAQTRQLNELLLFTRAAFSPCTDLWLQVLNSVLLLCHHFFACADFQKFLVGYLPCVRALRSNCSFSSCFSASSHFTRISWFITVHCNSEILPINTWNVLINTSVAGLGQAVLFLPQLFTASCVQVLLTPAAFQVLLFLLHSGLPVLKPRKTCQELLFTVNSPWWLLALVQATRCSCTCAPFPRFLLSFSFSPLLKVISSYGFSILTSFFHQFHEEGFCFLIWVLSTFVKVHDSIELPFVTFSM